MSTNMSDINIAETLLEKGIKPSFHRIKILEYLVNRKNHPTADMIFRDISPSIPTLSKTTVYNTLKTLLDYGVIISLNIDEGEQRFDADCTQHAHLKCISCGNIFDLAVDDSISAYIEHQNHIFHEVKINIEGICADCAANINK